MPSRSYSLWIFMLKTSPNQLFLYARCNMQQSHDVPVHRTNKNSIWVSVMRYEYDVFDLHTFVCNKITYLKRFSQHMQRTQRKLYSYTAYAEITLTVDAYFFNFSKFLIFHLHLLSLFECFHHLMVIEFKKHAQNQCLRDCWSFLRGVDWTLYNYF